MGDGLKKAKELLDKAKPRSKGSAGRESAEKSREKSAKDLEERLGDRFRYDGQDPELRYTGKKVTLSDDTERAVKAGDDWFNVIKEDPEQKKAIVKKIVEKATDPEKVYDLTNREREILAREGYTQGRRQVRPLTGVLSDVGNDLSRALRDGKELSPKWVGKMPVYKRDKK
jgi:hypothetical protein